jgi:pSer/pThr/pTyr-binding forkhead associated (FHA) protein
MRDSIDVAQAERLGCPFLLFSDRDGTQQLFSLTPGLASVSVGRRSGSDLVLEWDERVSRLHARFERAGEAWTLVDDGFSTNGTFVNGERLTGTRQLEDGDSLQFGTTTVVFRLPRRDRVAVADTREPPPDVRLSTTQRRVLVALCRPYKARAASAGPATDEQIADELVLSVAEVRAHVDVLCAKLGIEVSGSHDARALLAERALCIGLLSERDL